VDHDQLFKAVLTAQLAPFLELFFPDEAAQLDLDRARFVDKELFAAPPMGPGREVDLLADVPLRATGGAATRSGQAPRSALIAIQIEVQSQRDPEFIWRNAEYYVLLRRLHGLPILPVALFPITDVLGGRRGQRPRTGYEVVAQRDAVLAHEIFAFNFFAVTLGSLDASVYLARPQALAGALAARMRRPPGTPPSRHKLACKRRIMDGSKGGSNVDEDEVRRLLSDVVEAYLSLEGEDAEEYEELLRLPENEGIRDQMKTWSEQQQEIGEARGEARGEAHGEAHGKIAKAHEDVLRVLEIKFSPLPADLAARVRAITSEADLDALLVQAVQAAQLSDVRIP
jgi:hypothetical protein